MIIGNDYLLRFDDTLALTDRRSIHNNAMVFRKSWRRSEGTYHIHLASSGEFMTPTDLCTFMLYSPSLQWKKHMVVSPAFLTTWMADTQEIKLSSNPFE